jgi:S-adenosylmethionine synthetase
MFDLRPRGIIETLDLLRPIYYPTAAYGHFGRTDVTFPWEAIVPSEEKIVPDKDRMSAVARCGVSP